jgi:hypothetical protein
MSDYSLKALKAFLDYVGEKGLVNSSTAQGWRVAVTKVLDDLSEQEQADVRKIDLEVAFRKFMNKSGGGFTPASLAQYRARAGKALKQFIGYTANPSTYKGSGGMKLPKRSDAGDNGSSQKRRGSSPPPKVAPVAQEMPAVSAGLSLPFPIRPDFRAQIVIPQDLTVDEARRMGAFILTLAADFKPKD